MRRFSSVHHWTLYLLLAMGVGCKLPESGTSRGATLALRPCRLKGVREEVRCGTLEVFADRAAKSGPKLSLNLAVVPALSPSPHPDPLFVLVGGPGQAATEHVQSITTMLEKVHRRRDLVFVDQRGTGKSSPLSCEPSQDAGIVEQFSEGTDAPVLKACLQSFEKAGQDPALYLTSIAMEDLDEVRQALGYSDINLWGISYGTRAALEYVRRYGGHVRSVVLDGVAPPTMSLPLAAAADGERAFKLIFDSCAADATCSRTFPNLREQFAALLKRLEATPAHPHLTHPVTGAEVQLTLTRRSFLRSLHGLLYIPEISSLLPLILDRAAHGDFQPFVTQALGFSEGLASSVSQGMFFSVVCTEDAPLATPAALAQAERGTYFQDAMSSTILDVCAFWPKGKLEAGYHAPVKSSVPTLLLSGELDPVTPPAHATEAAAQLEHATQMVVPGVGHGASQQGCVPNLIAEFIDNRGASALSTDCVKSLRRPPFFVSFAGPTP